MSTNFANVSDATLQKFCDKMLTCVRSNNGNAPAAAPNAFKDRLGKTAVNNSTEVTITVRVSGATAWIKVVPDDLNTGVAFEGSVDVTTLATVLA